MMAIKYVDGDGLTHILSKLKNDLAELSSQIDSLSEMKMQMRDSRTGLTCPLSVYKRIYSTYSSMNI